MNFEFATANRIRFGAGSIKTLSSEAAQLGKRALLVLNCPGADSSKVKNLLDQSGIDHFIVEVCGEPTIDLVGLALGKARSEKCDLVISFGGGSAIDTGKAIAVMMANPGELKDYLEIVGKGQLLKMPSKPFIAIPTTAGTGSEVTKNAVIAVPDKQLKVSLRSPFMLPCLAIVDPELTCTLPPSVTASTGMDALTQVIEPFVSKKANEMVDMFCREGITRAARSLRQAFMKGSDIQAREDMALTSLLGGLSLSNAGLGAVHGFAAPIGGMFKAPHVAVCAQLLPRVVSMNVKALMEREPANPAIQRYKEIAQLLTGDSKASIGDGILWLEDLCNFMAIPTLSSYGITLDDLPVLVDRSAVASSMQANPLPLTKVEMMQILEQAL
jgi:alcohol dehydrogenase class IV